MPKHKHKHKHKNKAKERQHNSATDEDNPHKPKPKPKHKHKHKHKHEHKPKHKHKHKQPHDSTNTSTNSSTSPTPTTSTVREPISLEDYYAKNTEFRAWLHARGKRFDEVRSPRRRYFPKFVRRWNAGELPQRFYQGAFSHEEKVKSLTGYQWAFERQMQAQEQLDAAQLVDSVSRDTLSRVVQKQREVGGNSAVGIVNLGARREDMAQEEEEDNREFRQDVARFKRKRERQRDQSVHEAALDEVAPKVSGRERELEKRREKAQKIHGAAQEKEDLRDGAAGYSDDFLMGGSDNTLERLKQKRRKREQQKSQQRHHRLEELRERESQRVQRFKQAMGLQEGQEIRIKPRND